VTQERDEDRTAVINQVLGEDHGDFAEKGNQRMSLINDALRRAAEAQRKASPPASPQMQFRPVEPAQHPRRDLGLIVPAALAMAALVTLLFIWQLANGHKASRPRETQALTPPAAQAQIALQPATLTRLLPRCGIKETLRLSLASAVTGIEYLAKLLIWR